MSNDIIFSVFGKPFSSIKRIFSDACSRRDGYVCKLFAITECIITDIDYIMTLLDWNESDENQCYGLELAKKVNCFNVFLQPCNKNINKNVWNNCAKILSDKSDEELSPYLPELFRWLKDLNWPGAICIYDRLIISEDELFEYELKVSITTAKAQNDKLWLQALKNLKKERKARDKK